MSHTAEFVYAVGTQSPIAFSAYSQPTDPYCQTLSTMAARGVAETTAVYHVPLAAVSNDWSFQIPFVGASPNYLANSARRHFSESLKSIEINTPRDEDFCKVAPGLPFPATTAAPAAPAAAPPAASWCPCLFGTADA